MLTGVETLAAFTADLRPADVPASVNDNAALRVLDTLGCALAAGGADFAESVIMLTSTPGGPGPCEAVLGLWQARDLRPLLALCHLG